MNRAWLHLIIVYIVWGSTYLGIRIAVGPGSGFPAFFMAGTRIVASSCILFTIALLMRRTRRLRITKREAGRLFVIGLLLWVGGNGLVSFAEQYVDSGYAALLVGSLPLWTVLMEAIIDRKRPSPRLLMSLLIGLSGIAVLNGPVWARGSVGERWASVALLAAAIAWGIGALWQTRKPFTLSLNVSSAYQQLFGGLSLLAVALLTNEPLPRPTTDAWWAWAYLTVFGSVIAFTSFMRALRELPTAVVMTYAYVNPVIAVVLGALWLNEKITGWTFCGALLIIVGVVGVFHEKYRRASRQAAKAAPEASAA